MVAVMQVDGYLVPAKGRGEGWQVVVKTGDGGLPIFSALGGGQKKTNEAPDVGLPEVRMELMESGLSRQLVGKVGWRELSPARMRCSIGFTCSQVRKLSWLWVQWMIIRRTRGGEVIHDRTGG